MSVQTIAWVLDHSESTGSTRCVLIAIANHCNHEDGEGWVHVGRICQEANCSEDTYRRAVQWAIEHGELEREVRAGGSPKVPDVRRPNLFSFPKMRPLQSAGVEAEPDPGNLRGSDPGNLRGSSPPRDAGVGSRAVPEPSTEPSENDRAPANLGEGGELVDDVFDVFWKRYPRKVGKPKAAAAFRNAITKKKASPTAIMAGLERWCAYWDDPQYIPWPATWLNQERWNDDPLGGAGGARVRRPRPSNPSDVMDGVIDSYAEAGVAPGSLFGVDSDRAAG